MLLPEMDGSREVPEITTQCWGILGKSPCVDYKPNSATGDEMRLAEMTPAGSATVAQ